jgi:hypothetical protein
VPSPSDERGIAVVRVLRIDADKNPQDHKIARLRALLIGLEAAYASGDCGARWVACMKPAWGSSTH